jgi:hypothetical protein
MRSFGATTDAALVARGAIVPRVLVRITGKTRDTGAPVAVGFWNDGHDVTVTIDGSARTYAGAGGLLRVDPVIAEIGLTIRRQVIGMSPVSPEVIEAVRGYDARLAQVEIHRGFLDPATRAFLDPPHRIFLGQIDRISFPAGPGESVLEVECESAARFLTKGLAGRYSDQNQRRRSDDRFFRHVDVSGAIPVVWGD